MSSICNLTESPLLTFIENVPCTQSTDDLRSPLILGRASVSNVIADFWKSRSNLVNKSQKFQGSFLDTT